MDVYLVEYGSPTYGDHMALFVSYELADEFYSRWLEIMHESPKKQIYVKLPEGLNVLHSIGEFVRRLEKDDRLGRTFTSHFWSEEVVA